MQDWFPSLSPLEKEEEGIEFLHRVSSRCLQVSPGDWAGRQWSQQPTWWNVLWRKKSGKEGGGKAGGVFSEVLREQWVALAHLEGLL